MIGFNAVVATETRWAKRNERKQAAREFADRVALGQIRPSDRFGGPVDVGDTVVFHGEVDMAFTVTTIRPVLDPRMPPGLVIIEATSTTQIMCQIGQPNMRVIVVAKKQPSDELTMKVVDEKPEGSVQ